jgi:hypothetical protein
MTRKENEMIAIKLNAGNDRNGNPRRVFVVIKEDGAIHEAIDEGYDGKAILFRRYPEIAYPCEFKTTPGEYRELLRDFAKKA